MSPPRTTRNSRNYRIRASPPASEIDNFRSTTARSCALKRKFYNEDTDSESDELEVLFNRLANRKRNKRSTSGSDTASQISASSPTSSVPSEVDSVFMHNENKAGIIFSRFPLEIHANILKFVESDRDVCCYGLVTKTTHFAVDELVWSVKYAQLYDVTPEHLYTEDPTRDRQIVRYWYQIAADEYRARKVCFNDSWLVFSRRNLIFELAPAERQILWVKQREFLHHMKNLLLESNAINITEQSRTKIVGKNFQLIRQMTNQNDAHHYIDILDSLLEYDFTLAPRGESQAKKAEILVIIQLCLLPMIFDPAQHNGAVFHWDASQHCVYASHNNVPIFKGFYKTTVNMNFLINAANFFRFHLKVGNGEGILYEVYNRLEEDQRPQMWSGKLPAGTQSMKGHWKGATTYLSSKDLRSLRINSGDQESYQDTVDDEHNCFMDLTFFEDEETFGAQHWPAAWDSWIISDPYSQPHPKTKALPKSRPVLKHFWGTSRGIKKGHMFGRLHAVTNQGDFHGWQRISMIKCFETQQGTFNSSDIWVYEGVVIPGGRIILGRWMQPIVDPFNPEHHESGPFIFWNVDRSTANPPITSEEAWAFSATIDDPLFQSLPVPAVSYDGA